jgi:hypothetical protein
MLRRTDENFLRVGVNMSISLVGGDGMSGGAGGTGVRREEGEGRRVRTRMEAAAPVGGEDEEAVEQELVARVFVVLDADRHACSSGVRRSKCTRAQRTVRCGAEGTCYAAVVAADADDAIAQRLRRDDVVAQRVEVLGKGGGQAEVQLAVELSGEYLHWAVVWLEWSGGGWHTSCRRQPSGVCTRIFGP